MDIKAAAIIGGGAIVVGLILYIPGHFLSKCLLRRSAPESHIRSCMTRLGMVVYGAMVFAMLVGYAQEHFAAQTWFGHFVSSWGGRLAYAGAVIALSACVEYLLKKRGYALWVRESVVQRAGQARGPTSGGPAA